VAIKNTLAHIWEAQGRYDEAEKLYLEVFQARKRDLGTDDEDTDVSKSNLGEFYLKQREFQKAGPLLREVLAWRLTRYHDNHPYLIGSRNALAHFYQAQRNYDDAEKLYQDAFELSKRLGGKDLYRLRTQEYLAGLRQAQMKYQDAKELYEKVLKSWEDQLGPAHPDALRIKSELGALFQVQGKYEDAEKLYLQILKQKLSPHHRTLATHDSLGTLYLETKEYDKAEGVLRQGLRLGEQYHPQVWTTFNTKSLLGATLVGQMRYEEAEKYLLEGYEGLRASAASIPPQDNSPVTGAVRRLGDLYEAWGKKDTAATWRGKLR
jgi:tetratricopeptide (TPR) repeat protein